MYSSLHLRLQTILFLPLHFALTKRAGAGSNAVLYSEVEY